MTIVRTLILVALFISFVLLWIWAWSKERRAEFDAAARAPLEEDEIESK